MGEGAKEKIIDFCVIPPLEETVRGFADAQGTFARYSELYGRDKEQLIQRVLADPVGFLLRLMDEAGVDIAVLTAEDAETTMGMRVSSDKVADLVTQHPERFVGMAAVDPHKGMDAIRKLERARHELNMQCLCLEPWLHKIRANHKLYYPIYAKCGELDMPVWIHTSINFVPKLSLDFGRPIYLDEVAGHFPELKLVAGHCGWP